MLEINGMNGLCMEDLGFVTNAKGIVEFSEPKLVETTMKKYELIKIGDTYYRYLKEKDYWQELNREDLRRLILNLFNEVDPHLWRASYEKRYMQLLEISIKKAKGMNPYRFKINFANGTYSFDTKMLEHHSKEDYHTYKNNYAIYKEARKTPIFDDFIDQITLGREELKHYLLVVMAYIISGQKKLQKFFILYGRGANGKSTLINLMTQLIREEFVTSLSLSNISSKFALSSVVGKKLIVASENESGKPISTQIIKNLTGDDMVQIEQKYKDSYSSRLNCEVLFSVNNPVVFSEESNGLKRRLEVIPFDFKINEENMDPDFEKKLEKELPDIMRKLIYIHSEFAHNGYKLPKCKEVQKAKSSFLKTGAQSKIGYDSFDFFEDNLAEDPKGRVYHKEFRNKFEEVTGQDISANKFWKNFDDWVTYKGYSVEEGRNGDRFRSGVRFKESQVSELEDVLD